MRKSTTWYWVERQKKKNIAICVQEFEALRIYEGVLTSPHIRGRSYGAVHHHRYQDAQTNLVA